MTDDTMVERYNLEKRIATILDPEAFGKREDGSWRTDWIPGKGQMLEASAMIQRQRAALASATALLPLVREAQEKALREAAMHIEFRPDEWENHGNDTPLLNAEAEASHWLDEFAATYRTGDDHAR